MERERRRVRLLAVRPVALVLPAMLLASACTSSTPAGPTSPGPTSPGPTSPGPTSRPAPVAASALEPFPACPHYLPNLRGRYVAGPAPLDFTGATAALLCTYQAMRTHAYVFKRRLPIRASVLPRVITTLNHSGPFDPSLADCWRGAPNAAALYLREATGNISLMTAGGGGCGPLIAMGLSLQGSGLLAALELGGY